LPPDKRKVYEWRLIVVVVFIAGFLAWRDEHTARILAEATKQDKIEPTTMRERDPNGLYQLGELVGTGIGSVVDRGHSVITFQAIKSSGQIDSNRELEYQKYVIKCQNIAGAPNKGTIVGIYVGVTAGAECEILRLR
jgi:hypothetical protein